ncbi:nucleotidyltransferase family protein [Bowmanella denitrificans]|uniref:Nucleotidyltransferase family protein n=1 Tax=Bowmanella denitrificans TaxID=366582 RepID=A0ABP3HEZ4_9ALTE
MSLDNLSKQLPPLLVLAGGLGTRLQSMVNEVPKPLAPVCGKPFMTYLIENWIAQGVRSFIFLLHHKAAIFEQYIASAAMTELLSHCSVTCVREPKLLGTGGAVANAIRLLKLNGDVLITNADTWLDRGFDQFPQDDRNYIGGVNIQDASRFGTLALIGERVTAFREKQGGQVSGWINAGIYRLKTETFLGKGDGQFSIEHDVLPQLAARGELSCVKLDGDFIDIGVPQDYLRFCNWIALERLCKL